MATSKRTSFLVSKRRLRAISTSLAHIICILGGISFILPFLWMVSTSLKPDTQVFVWPPQWIPKPPQWTNYPGALNYIPFFHYYKNTLVICALTVIGTLFSCSLGAYSFSRIKWKGRDLLFYAYLSTMMLPYQVTMIPLFVVFKRLDWVGTNLPLIVPAFFGNAFYVFLLRQFFLSIPQELSDSAWIDGCTEFDIYARIILPLAKPALATVTLFTFLAAYQDFLAPLIYLSEPAQYTISLGLQEFRTQFGAEWQMLMAASTVVVAPVILLFFLVQRTFIQGITLTGIKG
ncbi:MAG: carbohydrate ABC transporter permease [Firmicutes bacterium]|nr:carbohydrate ABC transporter permease [Bacillota bacterium]